MWALVENNSVTRVYTRPTAVTIGFVAATYYDEDILYEEGDALPILSYYKHEDTLPEGKIAGDIKTQAEVGDVKIAAGSLKNTQTRNKLSCEYYVYVDSFRIRSYRNL